MMRADRVTRGAAVVLLIEALGLFVLAGWQVLVLLGGDTDSVASSIALIVLTAIATAAVAAFSAATLRGSHWGRSGGIVMQLLTLAIALGALGGRGGDVLVGLGLAALGIVGLVLLILAVRHAARAGGDGGGHDDPTP